MIKTLTELKEEWGQEKYVEILGEMTGWMIKNYPGQSMEDLQELQNSKPDVFTCFESYMVHGANS